MYLIHFAAPHFLETWKALEELYSAKKIRVIGVANFEIQHLEKLMRHSVVPPMINQIETHPEFPQIELHNYLSENHILHAAWAPLGQGNKELHENILLKNIAQQYGKTVAQIILRWHIERGVIIIPKSASPKRINENSQLFDFKLSEEDMAKIEQLNTGKRYSHSPTGYMINPVYTKLMKLFVR